MPNNKTENLKESGGRSGISKETLEHLFEKFCEHFESTGYPLRKKGKEGYKLIQSHFYPNKNPKVAVSTVKSEMEGNKDVQDFVKNNGWKMSQLNFGNWFYKMVNELPGLEPGAKIGIQHECYKNCFFIFLGYKGPDDFEQKCNLGAYRPGAADMPEQATKSAPPPDLRHYVGVYYSIKNYRIKKFLLTIDFSRLSENKFQASEWGFHVPGDDRIHEDDYIPPEKVESLDFEGEAYVSGKKLYINLRSEVNERERDSMQMNIIGICENRGGRGIENQIIIPCSVQTISLRGYNVSLEAFLIQIKQKSAEETRQNPAIFFGPEIPGISVEETTCLGLYLMLQRRNFWTRDTVPSSLNELQVRFTPVRYYTKWLAGKWRIWNFGIGEWGRVIQSLLEIKEGPLFTSFLYPYVHEKNLAENPSLEKQAAVLTLSDKIPPKKLCFASYVVGEGSHLNLINYAIFDLNKLRKGYAEGVYISGGNGSEQGLIGGYCVMSKIVNYKEKRDKPQIFTRDKAEELADKMKITEMYESLHDLWKKKNDRHRTRTGHYVICFEPERGFLLIKRERGMFKGRYDFPGGQIEFGESPHEWLKKRFEKQTGAKISMEKLSISAISSINFFYNYDEEKVKFHSVGIVYNARIGDGPHKYRPNVKWMKKQEFHDPGELTPLAHRIFLDVKDHIDYLTPPENNDEMNNNFGE